MGKSNDVWVRYFRDKRRFADLFNGICFQGKQVLKPELLSEGSEVYEGLSGVQKAQQDAKKIIGGNRDIKMCYGDKEIFRMLAVEDQNKVDYSMPFRCMQYDTMEYRRQLDELRKKNDKEKDYASGAEKICGVKKTDRLIPVYTLCLYHGEEKWDGPRSLKDMMDFGNDEDGMSGYFVDYKFLLFCMNEAVDLSIFRTEIRKLFEILKYRKDKAGLKHFLEDNPEYSHVDAETMEVVAVALNAPNIWEERERYVDSDEEEYNMCQALREWAEEERTLGEADGRRLKLIEMVCKKIRKGKSAKAIAEELEEDFSAIQAIYNAAEACAPDYEEEEIYKVLYGKLKKSTMDH